MLFIAIAAAICVACLIRVVHLKADTPAGLSSDHGTYVDEGYKTLAARNLILFGAEKWHPADTYEGWLSTSPLTQWSYYLSFLAAEPDIGAARAVTIVYYALFLVLYFFFLYNRYSASVFYGGLLLFGLESTLFFFSRIALFEIPMATFFYALVMSLVRIPATKSHVAILVALVMAAILAFCIKKSALVYFAPVFLAMIISLLYQQNFVMSARVARYSIVPILGVAILLDLTYSTWSSRLDLGSHSYVSSLIERSPSHTAIPPFWHGIYGYLIRLMDNGLLKVSPFVVLAGIFCAARGVLCEPSYYLKSLYRLTLICLVILGPIVLALFKYHPLRYYVPLLPAHILISLEWLSFQKTPGDLYRPNLLSTTLAVLLLTLFVSYCAVALGVEQNVNVLLLDNVALVGIGVLSIVLLIWIARPVVFSHTGSLVIILGLLGLGFAQSLVRIGDFMANPTYGAEQVRQELMKSVNSHEAVAGEWAPFFALGTPIRASYTSSEFNPPDAIFRMKPQYFLHSDVPAPRGVHNELRRHRGISFGLPRHLGAYNESIITLYPLSYTR